jgi:hypothetical protein
MEGRGGGETQGVADPPKNSNLRIRQSTLHELLFAKKCWLEMKNVAFNKRPTVVTPFRKTFFTLQLSWTFFNPHFLQKIRCMYVLLSGWPDEFVKSCPKCSPTHFFVKTNSRAMEKMPKNTGYFCKFQNKHSVSEQKPKMRKIAQSGHPDSRALRRDFENTRRRNILRFIVVGQYPHTVGWHKHFCLPTKRSLKISTVIFERLNLYSVKVCAFFAFPE